MDYRGRTERSFYKTPSMMRRGARVTGRGVCWHFAKAGVALLISINSAIPSKVAPQISRLSLMIHQGRAFFIAATLKTNKNNHIFGGKNND
ncbi:MAG: hypothetical protein ACOX8S_12795 [Christensenellales bacterium]|jgi:hypothetical protein